MDTTWYCYFLAKPDESIDHLIGDESVNKYFFSFYKTLQDMQF